MNSDAIKNEIKTFLELMGFGADLESVEVFQGTTSRFSVRLRGGKPEIEERHYDDDELRAHASPSSMLIGERGNNLIALEYLIKRLLQKKYGEDVKFTLDINDYRMKQLEELKQDVKAAAKEVRTHRKEVPLRPMSSFERRIVHLLLAEYPDITTESIGQDQNRRVVIKPYP